MTEASPKTTEPIHFGAHAYGEFTDECSIKAAYPHFDLFFVHEGALQLQLAGQSVDMQAPQAILIYPNTPFESGKVCQVGTASIQHFDIVDPAAALPACLHRLAPRNEGFALYCPEASQAALNDVKRAIQLAETDLPDLYDRRLALLTLILTELQSPEHDTPKPTSQDPKFGRLLTFLEENLDRKISLEDMAGHVELSASHFRAVFRRRFGISPGTFFLHQRMEHAARFLRETRRPIKSIARAVGYEQLPHFYRAFQRHHGQTPAAYRRENTPRG